VPIALTNGISEFETDVLGENCEMLDVFEQSGFDVYRSSKVGTVRIEFSILENQS
jgi:hypothetical protein